MLNKNNKLMFFILMIPFYFLLLVCLIGMNIGSIEWLNFAFYALLMFMAAWALSRRNSIFINIVGLLFFAVMGVSLIYPTLTETVRTGPWTINIYMGVILIFWGLIAFVYDCVKLKTEREISR